MSHFSVFVLGPKELADQISKLPTAEAVSTLEEYVGEQIAAYSEQDEVPEYDAKCYCVGRDAQTRSREVAEKEFGTIDSLRQSFKAPDEDLFSEASDEAWEQHTKDWDAARKAAFAADDGREAPDPECDTCDGTGLYKSNRNPNSKWDWYQIGGRWGGHLKPGYNPVEDPDNQEVCFICSGGGMRNDELGRQQRAQDPDYKCNGCGGSGMSPKWPSSWAEKGGNWAPVNAVLQMIAAEEQKPAKERTHILPFGIVTLDKEWHEKGKMGWWAMVRDKQENWDVTAKQLLEANADCLAIVVDCHI